MANQSRDLLTWRLHQGRRALTCGVIARGAQVFDVVTLPDWNLGGGAVETFRTASAALRRHAAIASGLRDAGWRTTSYTH